VDDGQDCAVAKDELYTVSPAHTLPSQTSAAISFDREMVDDRRGAYVGIRPPAARSLRGDTTKQM